MNIYITLDIHNIIEINQNHLDFYHPCTWFDSTPFQFLGKKEYPDGPPAYPSNFFTQKGIRELITGDQRIFDDYYWDILIEKLEYEISQNQKTRLLPDSRFSPETIQKMIFQSRLQRSMVKIYHSPHFQRLSKSKKYRIEIIYLHKLGHIQPQFISYLSMTFQKERRGPNHLNIYRNMLDVFNKYMESPKFFFIGWDLLENFTIEEEQIAEKQSEEMLKEM